jgi:hypothetical protein
MLPNETRFFNLPGQTILSAASPLKCSEIKAVLDAAGIEYEEVDVMETHALINLPRIENPAKFMKQNGVLAMMNGFRIESLEAVKEIVPDILLITSITQDDLNRAFA